MRPDMYKVIVERPRHASDRPNGTVAKGRRLARDRDPEAMDSLSTKAPMKPHQDTRKYLNENLSPLRRFLMSNVGRQWDEVYSELRAHLSPRNAVQMHVCEHIEQFVSLHVRTDGGNVYRLSMPWIGPRPLWDDGRTLYVDPITRRLCRPTSKGERYRRPEPDVPKSQRLKDGRLAVAIHGAWFAIETEPLRATVVPGWDVVFRGEASALNREERRALYGSDNVYAKHKRQLSKTECRRAGLS